MTAQNRTTNSRSYMAVIEVSRSPHDVFECIIQVSKWWGGKDLEGLSRRPNDEFTIRHGEAHYSKQKLIEIVPDRRVVWRITESRMGWLERNKHEWTNTRLVFEIAPAGNGATVHFTHEGLVPALECYPRCSEGWNMVITEYLFRFITDGRLPAQLHR